MNIMTAMADARSGHFVRTSAWSNRFIIAAIVQDAVIAGLTLAFVAAQL
jgi:hypothetical protein